MSHYIFSPDKNAETPYEIYSIQHQQGVSQQQPPLPQQQGSKLESTMKTLNNITNNKQNAFNTQQQQPSNQNTSGSKLIDYMNNSSQKTNTSLVTQQKEQSMVDPEVEKKIQLKDLCAEDKAKIGQLIKKLAEEQQEKELWKSQYMDIQTRYTDILQKYEAQNQELNQYSKSLREEYNQSLKMIKQSETLRKSQENLKNVQKQRQQQSSHPKIQNPSQQQLFTLNQNNSLKKTLITESSNHKSVDISNSMRLDEFDDQQQNIQHFQQYLFSPPQNDQKTKPINIENQLLHQQQQMIQQQFFEESFSNKSNQKKNQNQIQNFTNQIPTAQQSRLGRSQSLNKSANPNKKIELKELKSEIDTLTKSLKNLNFAQKNGTNQEQEKLETPEKLNNYQQEKVNKDDDRYISPNFKGLIKRNPETSQNKHNIYELQQQQQQQDIPMRDGEGNLDKDKIQQMRYWIQHKKAQIEQQKQSTIKRQQSKSRSRSKSQGKSQKKITTLKKSKSPSQQKQVKKSSKKIPENSITGANNTSNNQKQKDYKLGNLNEQELLKLKDSLDKKLGINESILKSQQSQIIQHPSNIQNFISNNTDESFSQKIEEFIKIKQRIFDSNSNLNISSTVSQAYSSNQQQQQQQQQQQPDQFQNSFKQDQNAQQQQQQQVGQIQQQYQQQQLQESTGSNSGYNINIKEVSKNLGEVFNNNMINERLNQQNFSNNTSSNHINIITNRQQSQQNTPQQIQYQQPQHIQQQQQQQNPQFQQYLNQQNYLQSPNYITPQQPSLQTNSNISPINNSYSQPNFNQKPQNIGIQDMQYDDNLFYVVDMLNDNNENQNIQQQGNNNKLLSQIIEDEQKQKSIQQSPQSQHMQMYQSQSQGFNHSKYIDEFLEQNDDVAAGISDQSQLKSSFSRFFNNIQNQTDKLKQIQ